MNNDLICCFFFVYKKNITTSSLIHEQITLMSHLILVNQITHNQCSLIHEHI